MCRRVALVGLGNVAQSHIRALEPLLNVEEVVGVDPEPSSRLSFRGAPIEVYSDLAPALARPVGLVIVATPTSSHSAVVASVRRIDTEVAILLEKPAAGTRADAEWLLGDPVRAEVVLHLSFAPEVLWGFSLYRTRARDLGRVTSFHGWFGDPYGVAPEARRLSYGDSWLDSGINGLGVLARFTLPGFGVDGRRFPRFLSTCEVHFDLHEEPSTERGSIFTTWQAAEGSRWTHLVFENGDHMMMDHTAGTGALYTRGSVAEFFAYQGPGLRRDLHYVNFYSDYFGTKQYQFPVAVAQRLHTILFAAADCLNSGSRDRIARG